MDSHFTDGALENARQAANRAGEDKLTDAVGEGLAAVAYALLDVAHALREVAAAQQK